MLPPTPGDGESPYSPYRSAVAGDASRLSRVSSQASGPVKNTPAAVVTAVALIGFACTIAGAATHAYTLEVDRGTVRASFWNSETCVYGVRCETIDLPAASWCTEKQVRFEYLQVASVLLPIFFLFGTAACAAEAGGMAPSPVAAVSLFFLWLWTLIQWGCIAGAYHIDYCGSVSFADLGYKMSVSFALYLSLWLMLSVAGIYYAIMIVRRKT